MIVSINVSRAGLKTLRLEYIDMILEFFSKLPDSIKVVWGLDTNENLASDEFAISIIATESRIDKEKSNKSSYLCNPIALCLILSISRK